MIILSSCSKMEKTYKEFVGDGEITYIGKADSLKVKSGKNRIELSWLLLSDPKVSGYKVFWQNKSDSIQGQLIKTNTIDTVKVLIENLKEGTYHFEVVLFDKNGHSSVKNSIIGKSYGSLYQESLLNRAYRSLKRVNENLIISWMEADENMRDIQLEYKNVNNIVINKVISSKVTSDTLFQFPLGGEFTYKTSFLPDSASIDTFYSNKITSKEVLTEGSLDKSIWKHLPLPTDSYVSEYSDWKISNLWDGITNINPNFFYQDPNYPGLTLPNWFSIDLGSKSKFTKIIVNHLSHSDGWLFNDGAPKTFEIYGSNDPDEDGSWSSWELIGDFTSKKPSNSPLGVLTEEDIELGRKGEEYFFSETITPYRYIRFKTKSTWGGNLNVMISELTMWGFPAG